MWASHKVLTQLLSLGHVLEGRNDVAHLDFVQKLMRQPFLDGGGCHFGLHRFLFERLLEAKVKSRELSAKVTSIVSEGLKIVGPSMNTEN